MNLSKKAQYNWDGESVPVDSLLPDIEPEPMPVKDERPEMLPTQPPKPDPLPSLSYEAEELSVDDSNDLVLEEVEDTPKVFTFTLPLVPGGEYQEDIEEPADLEVEEDDEIEVENDPWIWTVGGFLEWLSNKMSTVPQHSGKDSAGLERVIAYFEMIDREISRAVRSDRNGEIDIEAVERARDELYKGIERCQDRLDKIQSNKHPRKKRKKKSDLNHDMVKEAQKTTHVGGIVVTVPLLISSIARTCINSMVSAGKDIEDVFDKLSAKYELTPREEMETMQLLSDMNYPIRRPRGYFRDEEIDYTSTENFDWSANYPG